MLPSPASWGRRVRALGPVLLVIALTPAAGSLRIEAEIPRASYNTPGSLPILAKVCGGASNNFALAGLDADGDWAEYLVEAGPSFCFVDSVRAAGEVGGTWQFRLAVYPDTSVTPAEPEIDEIYPPVNGRGLACPVPFDWVQSSGAYCLSARGWIFRIIRVGAGDTRLDFIQLHDVPSPVDETSWGRIKVLYAPIPNAGRGRTESGQSPAGRTR